MKSAKYSTKQIKEFYWNYKFTHGCTKDVFLSDEENKKRLRNKKGIEYALNTTVKSSFQ